MKGLKELSRKLASDVELRNRVASGDEKALAGFELSAIEKKAVKMTRGLGAKAGTMGFWF